jgi:hypothetical protein
MRLKIQIQELDLFKQGLSLFQTRASLASETDLSAEQDLNEYIFAAKRNPVQLNGADLIERGTPICKEDTSQFKALNPEKSTVCSTVLDLARIEALVPEFEYQKPEISEALKRMSSDLAEVEKSKFASSEALEKSGILTSAQRSDYDFYLTNWRLKVSALTTWKRYEAQSGLIEKVRNCADGSEEGICAAGFRSYFAPAISEYLQWDPTNVSSNLDFRQALKNEVYHDIRQQYPSKHNLKWLLEVQKLNAQAFIPLHGKLEFASNFSKIAIEPEKELKVVGEMAPLFFGKLSTLLLSNGDLELKLVHSLTFNDKSMLISHSKLNQSQSANYLPQPGDSGSVLVTDSTPIGIVSTVDGVETSGGTSILPLPEFPEDSNEPLREGGDEIIKEPASAHVNTCR